tara:strand:+ start:51 stop:935 length:885 start_codon:yes stop_codon:yes gene_type:complete
MTSNSEQQDQRHISEKGVVDALAQEQLHDERMRSLGVLAGGIAHEINTPCQYVADNLKFARDSAEALIKIVQQYQETRSALIRAGKVPEDAFAADFEAERDADLEFILEEFVPASEQGVQGMNQITRIVRAIKEFSHPGSNEYGPVAIAEIVEIAGIITKNSWKYVANLEVALPPDLPEVRGNRQALLQVLVNLINNAADAIAECPKNGAPGQIKVSADISPAAVLIRLSDNGMGMPDDVQAKAMDAFYTTKSHGKGSGQGLAISKAVIETHGGDLSFVSKKGHGTEFQISLPR